MSKRAGGLGPEPVSASKHSKPRPAEASPMHGCDHWSRHIGVLDPCRVLVPDGDASLSLSHLGPGFQAPDPEQSCLLLTPLHSEIYFIIF